MFVYTVDDSEISEWNLRALRACFEPSEVKIGMSFFNRKDLKGVSAEI
jgi:hypothetical protein